MNQYKNIKYIQEHIFVKYVSEMKLSSYIYPCPEEPYSHISNPCHWSEDKVHNNGCDKNIIKWKNLKQEHKQFKRQGKKLFSHSKLSK